MDKMQRIIAIFRFKQINYIKLYPTGHFKIWKFSLQSLYEGSEGTPLLYEGWVLGGPGCFFTPVVVDKNCLLAGQTSSKSSP